MALPRLRQLLPQLDTSTHTDRVRTLALLGRDNKDDPELGRLLDELAAKSGYHCYLSLVAAEAAGDQSRVETALTHPSSRVRTFATTCLLRTGPAPEDASHLFLTGSADVRRRLRRFINRHGQSDLADALIDEVRRELGDGEAAALLPACSEAIVRRLLPELAYAVPRLASLVRRHTAPLLDHIESSLEDLSPRRRDMLWHRIDAALGPLSIAAPDRVLHLIETLGPSWVVPHGVESVFGYLIRYAPARIARLIAEEEYVGRRRWRLPPAVLRNVARFSPADRVRIAKAMAEHVGLFFSFIGSLPPSERAELFRDATAGSVAATKMWEPGQLEVLPHEARHAEAERILGLRIVKQSEELRFRYIAFLPFAQARAELEPQLGRATTADRAAAYSRLVRCAQRDRTPQSLSEALHLCRRTRNDQDEVRQAVASALAQVPPVQLTDDHLDDLQELVTAAVEARDTSAGTIRMLTYLACRMLGDAGRDPSSQRFLFAVRTLDELAGKHGLLAFPALDRLLPAGAETALIEILMPRLRQDSDLGQYQLLLSFAASLGERGWRHHGLQALIGEATHTASDSVVRQAVQLWLADPRPRAQRVEQLLATDESFVTLDPVLSALIGSRQDLLDLLLRPRPVKGRFRDGKVRYVPVVVRGTERWLPRQCEAYRTALAALIATSGTPTWTQAAAIRSLARLPEIGLDAVRPYLESSDVVVEEAALAALAWTDRPGQALGTLLSYTGTDRARVASYAATRCARFVLRNELTQPFGNVLDGDSKVTSRKEAARVLGAHRPRGATDALLLTGMRPDTHRDIRIAVGRALRGVLDDDRVWGVYAKLSSDADDAALSLLGTTPEQIPHRHRARYAGVVMGVSRSSSPRVREAGLAALGAWAPWERQAATVVTDAIVDLGTGNGWRSGLWSLGEMLRDGIGWEQTRNLVTVLASRSDDADLDAGDERDRPSWQRLGAVTDMLTSLPALERLHMRSELLQIADLLGSARGICPEELMVRFSALDWAHAGSALHAIAARLDDHLLLVARAMADLDQVLQHDEAMWQLADLEAAVVPLLGSTSLGAGALAVQLVQAAGDRYDWPRQWRERLRQLRAHPSDVSVLANAVRTADE